jgi:hypothetical protein
MPDAGGKHGSALLDFEYGEAVGLHHAGAFEQANFAVKASKLGEVPHELQVLWNHLGRGGRGRWPPWPVESAMNGGDQPHLRFCYTLRVVRLHSCPAYGRGAP